MEILNQTPETERMQNIVKDYREKILGKNCIKYAPDRYWEIGLINELKISPMEWDSYSLDTQAQIMARQYLSNMVSLINAHYDAQDDNIKKQKEESDKLKKERNRG